jgi:hypothetical protein
MEVCEIPAYLEKKLQGYANFNKYYQYLGIKEVINANIYS